MKSARLFFRLLRALILALPVSTVFLFFPLNLSAQSAEFTQNSGGATAVSLEVPLANYPGRGMSLPVTLHYSSRSVWRVGFLNDVPVTVNGYSIHRSVAEAIYAEHSTAGWTTSLMFRRTILVTIRSIV